MVEVSVAERNKRIAQEFYELAFNQQKPVEAVSKYVGKVYRQHNPTVRDGPDAFVAFVSGFVKQFPKLRVNIKRVIAEGNLVVTHSHLTLNPTDRGSAVVDIFRIENGKIVEHWDVMQQIPEKSANTNTMF